MNDDLKLQVASDVGEVAHSISEVTDLVSNILDRADRDAPEKEFHENIAKIQNAFADNTLDSDEFRRFVDKLFNTAGHPLTPTRDVPTGRREFQHAALVAISELIKDKTLLVKALNAVMKNKS